MKTQYILYLYFLCSYLVNATILYSQEAYLRFLRDGARNSIGPFGDCLVEYRDSVRNQKVPCPIEQISAIWNTIQKRQGKCSSYECDTLVLSDEDLILHESRMNRILSASAWKDRISENDYLNYLLPYRASYEMIDIEGDSLLREQYLPLVENVKDPIEDCELRTKVCPVGSCFKTIGHSLLYRLYSFLG